MTDVLRQKLCDLVAAHGLGVADDPRRCGELLRESAPDDGEGVEALVRALEARVPARLALLTEPLALAPLTSGLVRRLVDEQGLSEEAARWAVESWAVALGKGGDGEAAPGHLPAYEHILSPRHRRRRVLWLAVPVVVVLAALGAWVWVGQRSEVRRISGRTTGIYDLALAADGQTVLVGCADNSLRLWDVDTGAELQRFDGHQGVINGVALSPDGRLALSCGGTRQPKEPGKLTTVDCVVRAWDVATGRQLESFGAGYKLTDAVLDSLHAAAVPEARVPETVLTKLKPLKDRKFPTETDFRAELARLLSRAELDQFQSTVVKECRVTDYPVPVYCVAFSPDGKLALGGMGDYEYKEGKYVIKDEKPVPFECVVCLYDAASGHELRRLEGHKAPVWCAVFTPDGRHVVSGGIDGTIRLWDVAGGQELRHVELPGKPRLICLAVSPDGKHLLTGDDQAVLRLWSLDDLELEQEQKRAAESIRGVTFSPDGRRALSGGDDYLVRLWNAETLAELSHYPGHTTRVTGVAFLPDGQHALSSSMDGTIRIWRLRQ